ncbi:MAG: sodium:proton antiporter [Euryarchaeota archaeon]|nr:sodium:proton antiporter [Euryarchaeota archaeon]
MADDMATRDLKGTYVKLLALVAGFVLLALLAISSGPPSTYVDFRGDEKEVYGVLSLIPAVVAIVLAFTTRQVMLALLLGIASGGIIYSFGAGVSVTDVGRFPWSRLNILDSFVLPQIGSRGYAVILIVYLWSLGGLIGLWGRTGGARYFVERAAVRLVRGPRSAKIFTWFTGVIFHQGGTISTVLAGTTVRPLLDEHKVSKEEAAYLVDSTASPIATVIPFNVWPAFIASVVVGTIPFFDTTSGAVAFFFTALKFNFYAIFAVLLTLLVAAGLFPGIGGIRTARQRVIDTGALVRPGSDPLTSKELDEIEVYPGYRTGLADFFLPLAFLLVIAIGPYVIQTILGTEQVVYVEVAFFSAVVVAAIVAVVKGIPVGDALTSVVQGAKGVTIGAIILGLAVSLNGVSQVLGTGKFVADLLSDMPVGLLPFLLLVAGMVTAFSTGTSFGTFAVLFPVAMPLAYALMPGDTTFLAMCFAAVVGGSVYGDQCSPISDTTILSSLATGCDLMDHVTSQLPYASIAAAAAGGLYLVLGFTLF